MAIAIQDHAQATTEIDLWGNLFNVIKVTKSNEDALDDKLAAVNKRFEKADLSKHASQVKLFAARMDVLLSPAAGGKKKASKIVLDKWNADDLTIPQVDAFWDAVQEQISRPT